MNRSETIQALTGLEKEIAAIRQAITATIAKPVLPQLTMQLPVCIAKPKRTIRRRRRSPSVRSIDASGAELVNKLIAHFGTQRKLSSACGISQMTLSSYARSAYNLPTDRRAILVALANQVGVTL